MGEGMRCYSLQGFQLWTFPAGYGIRADGKRRQRKTAPIFNWHPAHDGGCQPTTRKVAASFLLTFRRELEKTLDQ